MAVSAALELLLFICLILTLSTCEPVGSYQRRNVLQDIPIIDKRQVGFFSILGVVGVGGTASYPRLEIRELEKNADQWNIYLLGLRRFQNVNQSDKLSYYQIAGIHGRPYIAWDGVNQVSGGFSGYCTHGSNIFPTWHRPYLALFEEMLYLNAREAISEFPNGELKDRYNNALSTLRIPYWDWAVVPPSGEGSMPWSLQRPTVEIILPNGTTTAPNPLFSYTFHTLSRNDFGTTPWTTWPSTLRDPSSNDANAASRNDLVAVQLDNNRPNLQSRVYNVLTMQHDYFNISNDLQPGDSLESVHDTIHNTVGSDGHFSMLAYAAFDPIFWLHHSNVDRIFAIWQALNPNSYVTPVSNPYATFTMRSGFVADANTALMPFHRDDAGNFWTSETIRSPSTFAYTYPELVGLNGNDTSALVRRVNALYGPNATAQKGSVDGELIDRSALMRRDITGAPNFSGERQYMANIKVHKFSLDGSFNVYIFLGNKPGLDSRQWTSEVSFIGVTGILAQSGVTDATKVKQQANGAVPLTAALEAEARNGQLDSMNEDAVATYLRDNLRWRISKTDGEEMAVGNVPGFQISVLWAEMEPAKSASEFPKMVGEYRILMNATDGRPGGFQRGDAL